MRSLAVCLAFAVVPATAGVTDVAWLAGAWCGTNHGTYQEEVWLAPRGGALVGMHRDTRGAELRGFEFFRITEDGGDLVYWAQPDGRPAVAFRGKGTQASVDFVNMAHAFPKRVQYRLVQPDVLVARIDDNTEDGKRREWTWTRDCGR